MVHGRVTSHTARPRTAAGTAMAANFGVGRGRSQTRAAAAHAAASSGTKAPSVANPQRSATHWPTALYAIGSIPAEQQATPARRGHVLDEATLDPTPMPRSRCTEASGEVRQPNEDARTPAADLSD